jgi:hypothetical protein
VQIADRRAAVALRVASAFAESFDHVLNMGRAWRDVATNRRRAREFGMNEFFSTIGLQELRRYGAMLLQAT